MRDVKIVVPYLGKKIKMTFSKQRVKISGRKDVIGYLSVDNESYNEYSMLVDHEKFDEDKMFNKASRIVSRKIGKRITYDYADDGCAQMVYEDLGEDMLKESNIERRSVTKPLKTKYLMSQKVKPSKRVFIDNEASRKLVFDVWKSNRNDSLGRLMLSSFGKEAGGNKYYGVWEEVKGNGDMYADVKTIDGRKWSFTELFLDEIGVKKLQENKVPSEGLFKKGEETFVSSFKDTRRRTALKKANEIGAEKLKEYGEKTKDEKTSYNEVTNIYKKTNPIDFGHSKHGRQRTKKDNKSYEVMKNLDRITKPLDKYLIGKGELSQEAWSIINPAEGEIQSLSDNGKTKEAADKIVILKKRIEEFLKKAEGQRYFNY